VCSGVVCHGIVYPSVLCRSICTIGKTIDHEIDAM